MTAHKDLKRIIRERRVKTGESYKAARAHVMRERARLLGHAAECLHGYGLCLWCLGKLSEALQVFERMLSSSPNDNQVVRFCWHDVRRGRSWEEAQECENGVRP